LGLESSATDLAFCIAIAQNSSAPSQILKIIEVVEIVPFHKNRIVLSKSSLFIKGSGFRKNHPLPSVEAVL